MASTEFMSARSFLRSQILWRSCWRHEQFFFSRAGTVDVDTREDTAFQEAPVQVDLHVAGALEFLVDHLVHLAARIHEGSGNYGEASAFLDVSRCAEETAWDDGGHWSQRHRTEIFPLGGTTVLWALARRVMLSEQDDHVPLVLHKPLGLFDNHVRHLDMPLRRFVEGRGDHLSLHRPLHVGHLLGTFVDEQNDKVDIGMIDGKAVGDLLEQHRLSRLGRGNDEAPLPLSDRSEQIHDPHGILGRA